MEKYKDILNSYNIICDDSILSKLKDFYNLLIEENKKYNLTRITDETDFIYKHFIDSILPIQNIKLYGTVCDMGAGAGFPSIPLALFNPDINFVLIDSVLKKVQFLNIVKEKLNLKNITVYHTRIEDIKKLNLKFDFILARALASINTLLEYSMPFLKKNCYLLAYSTKTYKEELKNAENAFKILNAVFENFVNYKFFYNNELYDRNLLIIKKIKETPNIFPRNKNLARLKPL